MQTHPSNFILDIYIYIYKIFPIPQFSITILKLSIQREERKSAYQTFQPISNRFSLIIVFFRVIVRSS